MFRKIRIRFILLASVAITCILISMIGVLNSARFFQSNGEIQAILKVLSNHNGDFPSVEETAKELNDDHISIDTISQYRYFSVVLNSDSTVASMNLDNISNISESKAKRYALMAVKSGSKTGTFTIGSQHYSYQVSKIKSNKGNLVVILDSTNYINDRSDFLLLSVQLSFYSLIFFIVLVTICSGYAVRPYVRNYEKQKRFITNAGHELKTPLAIISANTELQELMNGENEWTASTKEQVRRLSNLVNQLVTLARMEERLTFNIVDLDFSKIVTKAANDFKSVTEKAGQDYQIKIQENIHVKGSYDELYELVSILIDNACKYCDEKGQIIVTLTKGKYRKHVRLTVSNSYADGKNVDYSRFFDRFYREDESHNNSKQSGYGIGLSMAESLVNQFKGKISVSYKNGKIRFTVLLYN